MATTGNEWLNHHLYFTECLIFPHQPMQTNTHTASQIHTQELWAKWNKIKFWLMSNMYCYLSLSSSFLRSCMSLCTTLSTCSASSLLRPDRSSLRPITALESRVKTLEPRMLVLKYFQDKAWKSLRNKREMKVILYSIGQGFL